MERGDYIYIWQAPDWPRWRYDLAVLGTAMSEVSRARGYLLGRLEEAGLLLRDQLSLTALTAVRNVSIACQRKFSVNARLITAYWSRHRKPRWT